MEKPGLTIPYEYEDDETDRPVLDHELLRAAQIAEALQSTDQTILEHTFNRVMLGGAVEGSF